MKTPCSRGPLAFLAAVGVCMFLVFGSSDVLAAGSVGTGAIGTAGTVGGGHSAGVIAGGAHVSAGASGRGAVFASARSGSGLHTANSLQPITATYGGLPRYLPGGFAPNAISHAPSINAGSQRASVAPSTAQAQTVTPRSILAAHAHNDWTDPSSTGYSGTVFDPQYSTDVLGNRFGSGSRNLGSTHGGTRFNRSRPRGYFNGYGYPYPYLFSGGYAPYFDGGLADYAAPASDYGDVAATEAPSAAAENDLSRPYPTNAYLITTPGDSTNAQGTGQAAASQGVGNPSVQSNSGPDSLVEAVQAELSRRGYFGGKIDAIYNEATHTAIQRFQNDQHLPASGRLNEATLHALQLD